MGIELGTTIRFHHLCEKAESAPDRIDFCDKSIHTYNIVLDGDVYHIYQGEFYRCDASTKELFEQIIPELI